MERILRVRAMEEEQSQRALERASAELAQLELALRTAGQRERRGRSLVQASAETGEMMDRVAGLEESRSSRLKAQALTMRIEAKESVVAGLRENYLKRRTSRMQAETLTESEKRKAAADQLRTGQQALDDWHLNRMRREGDAKGKGK